MKGRFKTRQRNYIILGLCSILLIMVAGYAAFRSQLNIKGTSNITSEWNVLITNIQSQVLSGTPEDEAGSPSHTETTASFSTKLYSPGDRMQYTVTVENRGNIDAVLKTIDKTDSNNDAIIFEIDGIEEGEVLKAKESTEFTVDVAYNSNTESQPGSLTSDLKVTLDYEQITGEEVPVGNNVSVGGISVPVVESGDGLYEDSYESGRYIYRGQNPNNYIEFNDELWRIVAKEVDGTYKIIRNDLLPNRAFDEANHRLTENNSYCQTPSSGCGVYAAVEGEFISPSGSQRGTVTEDSSIKEYLNDDYYVNNINETAKSKMTEHSFNIGAVEKLDDASLDSIEKNFEGEKMYQWIGNVGLVNVTDILKASTNPLCISASVSQIGENECNSNYLLDRGSVGNLAYWTINAVSYEAGNGVDGAWYVIAYSSIYHLYTIRAQIDNKNAPRPVVFLKSSIVITGGTGTHDDPYTIM